MRKIFAAILAVILVVPLLFAALMIFALRSWVLDRGFYATLLADEQLYELALEEWRADPDTRIELPPLEGLQGVPEEALGAALREVLTARYLRSQALGVLDQAFDALEGRVPALALSIDLAPLKAELRGEAGLRFARALAEALPVCPASAAGAAELPAGGALPSCRPRDLSVDRLAQSIASRMPAVLGGLPDAYLLTDGETALYHDPAAGLWYGFVGAGRLLWAAVILGVIASGFWVGTAFLAGRDRREILQWLGGMLAAPALLTLLAGLGVRLAWFGSGPWFSRRLPFWLGSRPWGSPWVEQRGLEVLAELSRTILGTVGRGFLTVGAVAAGVAAGLIIWSVSAPRSSGT